MDARCPYYDLVPKDYLANLAFREQMVREGGADRDAAEEIWIMCKRDILFYVNTFVWTYDPRTEAAAEPFITYPFQDEALLEILDAFGKRDLLIEKSRDMGASWICLTAMEHQWHFEDLQSFLMVSRKEGLVDSPGDSKSLFWKVDFILDNQPMWLLPRINRTKLHLGNADNGSVIDGESTTGDVARGDRRRAILLDEFAYVDNGHRVLSATADATPCRLLNSTPNGGTGNAFYDMRQLGTKRLTFHWTRHPEKAKGLYYDDDNLPRSPWYDEETKRRPSKREIAQELDIDYEGATERFFDQDILDKHRNEHVRPPYRVGELVYDIETAKPIAFEDLNEGLLKLWVNLDNRNRPPSDRRYVMGADIATGTRGASGRGGSNSVLSVWDTKTHEKVAEYAVAAKQPHEMAKYAVALCWFFTGENGLGAHLIWEANGPGGLFGDSVLNLGYRNIYYRRREESVDKKTSTVPGFWTLPQTKMTLLGEYRRALGLSECINRSQLAIEECQDYIYLPNGGVGHRGAEESDEATQATANHGDRVIADALGWKMTREFSPDPGTGEPQILPGSLAWRRMERQRELAHADRSPVSQWDSGPVATW